MTYTKIEPEKPHKCDPLPHPTSEKIGTVLRCDECQAEYILQTVSQYGESWSQWKRK